MYVGVSAVVFNVFSFETKHLKNHGAAYIKKKKTFSLGQKMSSHFWKTECTTDIWPGPGPGQRSQNRIIKSHRITSDGTREQSPESCLAELSWWPEVRNNRVETAKSKWCQVSKQYGVTHSLHVTQTQQYRKSPRSEQKSRSLPE